MNQTGVGYAPGELIFEQGEPGDCAYVIEEGAVEIFATVGETATSLAILSAGDLFGEMALISGDTRSASARAMTTVRVTVISRSLYELSLARSEPMLALILRVVLRRFNEVRDKLLNIERAAHNRSASDSNIGAEELQVLEWVKLAGELGSAASEGQLRLLYQPIVSLQSGRLSGFEALVRWQHPKFGLIPPGRFIQLAEASGEIVGIGRWIFETACADIRTLREKSSNLHFDPEPWVSINVSPAQIVDDQTGAEFVRIVAANMLPPGCVKVELTESVLASDPQRAMSMLQEIRSSGMRVAIDDFGTGYSSLSYLHLFPFDTLKLDQSFVRKLGSDDRVTRIVHTIVNLARQMEIDIVAEGVELTDAEAHLRELGCQFAQGYLYSKPVSLEEAFVFLERNFSAAS